MTSVRIGGASAPLSVGPDDKRSPADVIIEGIFRLLGRMIAAYFSLWAFTLPATVGLVIWWRANSLHRPPVYQTVLFSVALIAIVFLEYRTGHLVGCWRAHQGRRARVRVAEHVEAGRLPPHTPITRRGRVTGFDVQAPPGWNHDQLEASVADLMAHYRVSTDKTPVTDAVSHGRLRVRFTTPTVLPTRVSTTPDTLRAQGSFDALTIGVGADDALVRWDLKSGPPHVLIVGTTGSGKSVAAYCLIAQALLAGCRVEAVDPKRLDFAWLTRYGVQPANTSEEAAELLERVRSVMSDRLTECQRAAVHHVRDLPTPPVPVVVVVDEAAELLDLGSKPPKGSPGEADYQARAEAGARLCSIARLGRAADVHLVLLAQRPDAAILSGQLRSQLSGRILVRSTGGPEAARMVGLPQELADTFEATSPPRGRCLWTPDSGGSWVEAQVPFVSDEILSSLPIDSERSDAR